MKDDDINVYKKTRNGSICTYVIYSNGKFPNYKVRYKRFIINGDIKIICLNSRQLYNIVKDRYKKIC